MPLRNSLSSSPSASDRNLDALVRFVARVHYYSEVDPDVALPLARRAAERICRRLLMAAGVEPGTRTLQSLIDEVRRQDVVQLQMMAPLLTIQNYGNFGSHDREGLERVDARYVMPCIEALDQLAGWYAAAHLDEHGFAERVKLAEGVLRSERTSAPAPAPLPGVSSLRIATVNDVIDWGWSGETLLDHLIALDFATIGGLDHESEGSSAQWAPVFMEHPDTWRLLVTDPGHIVGYWHFVPLSPGDYALARDGTLLDGAITSDRVELFELAGEYDIYFVSIVLHQRHRGIIGLNLLLNALFEQLTFLAKQDIYITRVCANAFTTVGEKLCQSMGMTRVGPHRTFGEIFEVTLRPLPTARLFDRRPELRQLYVARHGL